VVFIERVDANAVEGGRDVMPARAYRSQLERLQAQTNGLSHGCFSAGGAGVVDAPAVIAW
jgi:hypothetical protein